MSWMIEHKTIWRIALGVVALAAFLGPWFFDLLFVPPEYTCTLPAVRLNDRFCGLPVPGVRFIAWTVDLLTSAGDQLAAGTVTFGEWAREFFFGLLLPLLPPISTALLVLRGDGRGGQVLNVVAWVLAAGPALLIGLSSHPEKFWVLWGVWLYIVLAAAALALEALTASAARKRRQDRSEQGHRLESAVWESPPRTRHVTCGGKLAQDTLARLAPGLSAGGAHRAGLSEPAVRLADRGVDA